MADAKAKTVALPYPDYKPTTNKTADETADETPDETANETAPAERHAPSMFDIESMDNDKLLELFGLVQAEILSRVATKQIKIEDTIDFKRITNALSAVLNNGNAVSVNTDAKWTNAI